MEPSAVPIYPETAGNYERLRRTRSFGPRKRDGPRTDGTRPADFTPCDDTVSRAQPPVLPPIGIVVTGGVHIDLSNVQEVLQRTMPVEP